MREAGRSPLLFVCAGIASLILAASLAVLKPGPGTPLPQTFWISTPPSSGLAAPGSPSDECNSGDIRHQWCEPRYTRSI